MNAFLLALKPVLHPGTTLQMQSDLDVINDADGTLTHSLSVPSQTTHTGSAPNGPYSAASGAVITWRTAGVMGGRRVRGRTFLVPIASVAYGIDGTIDSAALTTISTAANALKNNASEIKLAVWGRPQDQHTNAKGEVVPARDGAAHEVTAVSVPDKVAVLRSRRD